MTNTSTKKDFLTVSEAIKLTNRTESTIRKLIRIKKVDYKKEKGKVKINKKSLLDYYSSFDTEAKKFNTSSTNENKLIKKLEEENQFLKDELKEKNRQIQQREVENGNLQELLKNQQILNKQQQENQTLLLQTKNKKGILQRFFARKESDEEK